MDREIVLFATKPSLRRVYFYAALWTALVLFVLLNFPVSDILLQICLSSMGTLVAILVYAHIVRYFMRYSITDKDIRCRTGVIARHLTVVPHYRITNYSADQSILERVLGLASVYFETAGSVANEATFKRILLSDAKKLAPMIEEKLLEATSGPVTPQQRAAQMGGS